MALLTDGALTSITELTGYDSAVLDVAAIENISLDAKTHLAQEEITLELESFLLHQSGWRTQLPNGASSAVNHIVASPALKRWHALKTLYLFYADAYHRQLNDRYRGKQEQLERMARQAKELLLLTGVDLVHHPVPRASSPTVWSGPMGSLSGVFMVQVQWVDHQGRTGAPSEWVQVTLEPNGAIHVSAPPAPNPAIGGYHIYVRTPEESYGRQTEIAVAPHVIWSSPGPLQQGPEAGDGQRPEFQVRLSRVLPRG
jgi:hypothetical protein